jgi:hypothetical protein
LQQICPSQSLLWLHDFGHEELQMPSQQMGFAASQSVDWLHTFGQKLAPSCPVYVGFRHRPGTLRLGSSLPTDVQQTSPFVVLQSLLDEHDFGHTFAAVQMPCV